MRSRKRAKDGASGGIVEVELRRQCDLMLDFAHDATPPIRLSREPAGNAEGSG
jgi:hypothetical protein